MGINKVMYSRNCRAYIKLQNKNDIIISLFNNDFAAAKMQI